MKKLFQNGLRELKDDSRDFSLGAVFPQIKLEEVPTTDFRVADPIKVKDQGESDLCSAYALTAVSEDQEGVELLPEYQFYTTKLISGNPEDWGADLRDACKSATKYGSLSVKSFPGKLGLTRTDLLRKEHWNNTQKSAFLHKKETYFQVVGKYDMFDNIRIALWQHKKKKCSILTGALWRSEWIDAPLGVIPKEYGDSGFGHAFKIFGQKVINNELYLEAQLSQGEGVGDKGLFYLPREVVNKEIGKYGVFMFKDILREEVESFTDGSKPLHKNFWDYIISLLK